MGLHPHLPLPSLPQSLLQSLPQSLPHRSLLQNLPCQSLHLPPAPSVTIKRLAFKLPMALIAPLIQFALKKCNKDEKWTNKGWCRLSCYKAGNGYPGDECCDESLINRKNLRGR